MRTCCRRPRRKALFPCSGIRLRPRATTGTSARCCGLPPSPLLKAGDVTVLILMIAPEPFFEPRGTPFSEFHRIRALTALGHQVDLVTYPFGRDVSMPGLRIFRCLQPPFMHGVAIGPSIAKLPLDALLTLAVVRRALGGRY